MHATARDSQWKNARKTRYFLFKQRKVRHAFITTFKFFLYNDDFWNALFYVITQYFTKEYD